MIGSSERGEVTKINEWEEHSGQSVAGRPSTKAVISAYSMDSERWVFGVIRGGKRSATMTGREVGQKKGHGKK